MDALTGEIVAMGLAGLALLAGVGYALRGEFSATRVSKDRRLFVRGREYHLHVFTGVVIEAKKSMQSRVWGGGDRQGRISFGSKTYAHENLMLLGPDGKQREFELTNFDIDASAGNKVSVVQANRSRKTYGPCIAVYNHSTDRACYGTDALEAFYSPNAAWYLIPVGAAVALSLMSNDTGAGVIAGVVTLVLGSIVTATVRDRIASRRSRRFGRREDWKRFIASL